MHQILILTFLCLFLFSYSSSVLKLSSSSLVSLTLCLCYDIKLCARPFTFYSSLFESCIYIIIRRVYISYSIIMTLLVKESPLVHGFRLYTFLIYIVLFQSSIFFNRNFSLLSPYLLCIFHGVSLLRPLHVLK